MLPELFGFLPTYGLLFATAVLLGCRWFLRRGATLGFDQDVLFNLCFYTMLGGILGAKLTLIVLDLDYYLADPKRLLGTIRSAGVVMGGILGGAVAYLFYARRHGLPILALGDAAAAPLAFAQAVGRVGCFCAGCCWGVPAEPGNPFAVVFEHEKAHTGDRGVPLVPVQLMHMGANLALAALLTWLWRRRPAPPGTVFWVYTLGYGVSRGLLEVYRGDAGRGLFFGDRLSTSQVLSIAAVVFAAGALAVGRLSAGRKG